MALMRIFGKVDKDGKLAIPDNVRREAGLRPGQLVEVRVVRRGSITISARNSAR